MVVKPSSSTSSEPLSEPNGTGDTVRLHTQVDTCMMLMQAMALPMQGSLLPQSQTSLLGQLQNGEVARRQPRTSEASCRSLQRSEVLNYVNRQNCSLLSLCWFLR